MIEVEFLKGPDARKRKNVTRQQAATLSRVGYVKVIEAKKKPAPEPDRTESVEPLDESTENPPSSAPADASQPKKRQYRRRDLTGETPAAPEREYQRRDLSAEK